MLNRLIAYRVADAFRTHLGFSDWKLVDGYGPDNSHPTPGNRYMFHARSGSGELARHGIYSLTLVVARPLTVYADVTLEEGLEIAIYPDNATVLVDTKPYGNYVRKILSESEIDEMRREWEPFRLVMEAVEAASAQLKAEAEAQKEDAE